MIQVCVFQQKIGGIAFSPLLQRGDRWILLLEEFFINSRSYTGCFVDTIRTPSSEIAALLSEKVAESLSV